MISRQEILNKRLLVIFENLKSHIAEVERCQQHFETKFVSPVIFLGQEKKEKLGFKPGDRQRGSTTNNIDILTLDVCLPSRIFSSFAMISNNKLFRNSTRILLNHIHNSFLFRGTWRIEMAKWVPAQPTTDSVSVSDKVISSCRITFFSDVPWNSKTSLSVGGFTCLII